MGKKVRPRFEEKRIGPVTGTYRNGTIEEETTGPQLQGLRKPFGWVEKWAPDFLSIDFGG
jgi:hypothetical protein